MQSEMTRICGTVTSVGQLYVGLKQSSTGTHIHAKAWREIVLFITNGSLAFWLRFLGREETRF